MKNSETVLLIEDDKDDQDFFVEALSHIGYATLYGVAGNGKEAIDKLEHTLLLPDIIFMDINMPLMNGIECLAALSKNARLKDIPVVILSTSSGQVQLAQTMGAKAFIRKPSDCKTLYEQIEKVLNMDFTADPYSARQTFIPVNFSC